MIVVSIRQVTISPLVALPSRHQPILPLRSTQVDEAIGTTVLHPLVGRGGVFSAVKVAL
jgi:hypothetical protein